MMEVGGQLDSSFNSTMNSVNSGLDQIDGKAGSIGSGLGSLTSSFGNLTSMIKGAAVAFVGSKIIGELKEITGVAIDSAAQMQNYRQTLNVIMGDEEKAAERMAWAADFANITPFDTDEVVAAVVQLESFGLKSEYVLKNIGDMAGVMNKDLLTAVQAVSNATMGELEMLKQFGIKKDMIAEKSIEMYGKSAVDAKGSIKDQEKFTNALLKLMLDRFEGGMELQAKTWTGLKSTISGLYETALGEIAGVNDRGEIVEGSLFDRMLYYGTMAANKLEEVKNSGIFSTISSKVGDSLGDTISWIEKTWDKFTPFREYIDGKLPEWGEKWSSTWTWIKDDFATPFGEWVVDFTNDDLPKLIDSTVEAADSIKTAFQEISPAFKTFMSEAADAVADFTDRSLKGVGFVADTVTLIGKLLKGDFSGVNEILAKMDITALELLPSNTVLFDTTFEEQDKLVNRYFAGEKITSNDIRDASNAAWNFDLAEAKREKQLEKAEQIYENIKSENQLAKIAELEKYTPLIQPPLLPEAKTYAFNINDENPATNPMEPQSRKASDNFLFKKIEFPSTKLEPVNNYENPATNPIEFQGQKASDNLLNKKFELLNTKLEPANNYESSTVVNVESPEINITVESKGNAEDDAEFIKEKLSDAVSEIFTQNIRVSLKG